MLARYTSAGAGVPASDSAGRCCISLLRGEVREQKQKTFASLHSAFRLHLSILKVQRSEREEGSRTKATLHVCIYREL